MANKIIILHPSPIIREGLSSLIKELFELQSVNLSNFQEMDNFADISGQKLIFLIDSRIDQKGFQTRSESFKSTNEVKLILIREPDSPSECEDNCTCCFNTDVTKNQLQSFLEPYFTKKTSVKHPNQSELTDREIEVVKQVAFGKTNKEIAGDLCISIHTVISHRKNITEKLGIKSISGLTVYAILNNLIDTRSIDPESLI